MSSSRLSQGQMWVMRGALSSAYMLTVRCERFDRSGITDSHAFIVCTSPPGRNQ
ncbi:hypothetical protein [Paraburkholderia caribensis]|uniref:hypothetical protein n=1 Tax=Paraburkholderia caribensis TaxID=75105 RepID=UPI0031D40C1C